MIKKHSTILAALLALVAIGAVSLTAMTSTTSVRPKTMAVDKRQIAVTDKGDSPDFAFPDKVAEDADSHLATALDKGDAVEVVNSLVLYSLAKNAISETFMPSTLNRIDSINRLETDPRVKSLLYLLQAHIYNGLWNRDRWKYDHREIPMEPLPSDYTEWSSDQFKSHIASLLEKACMPREELLASPLSDWRKIITADEYTFTFYPTLYDLVAYNAINMLDGMANNMAILPVRCFMMPQLTMPIPVNADVNPYVRTARQLTLDLEKSHADRMPALITARIKGLKIMEPLIYFGQEQSMRVAPYLDLYEQFGDTDWSVEALIAYEGTPDTRYLETVKSAIEKFPDYFRIDALRAIYDRSTIPSASFSYDYSATPGVPFSMNVRLENTTGATLHFYKSPYGLKNPDKELKLTASMLSTPSEKVNIEIAPRSLPYAVDTTVTVTLRDPAVYYVRITARGTNDNSKKSIALHDNIVCSDIAPMSLNFDGLVYPYAVNSSTGSPMPGVNIGSSKRGTGVFTPRGTTNADGTLDKPLQDINTLRMTKGEQVVDMSVYSYRNPNADQWRPIFHGYTSLPLYHHGDSVQWAVVAFSIKRDMNRLLTDKPLTVKFKDSNYETFDSVRVVTDATGRATGTMKLPAEGISGSYSMWFYDNDGNNYGCTYFTVNDYKLPTFTVTVSDLQRHNSADSAIVVTCKAATYSDFPVGDANVQVTLQALMPGRWYMGNGMKFWSTQLTTDKDGLARLTIPREVLELSPVKGSHYTVNFNVTSPAGESHDCSRSFSTGKPLTLQSNHGSIVDMESSMPRMAIAYDANGTEIDLPLEYELSIQGKTIATVKAGQKLPHSITPGIYTVKAQPVDSTKADPLTITGVTMYRAKGKCPVEKGLFVPKTNMTAYGTASLLYGVPYDDASILVTEIVDGQLASRRWVKVSGGMQSLPVKLPAESKSVKVHLALYHDNVMYSSTIEITNESMVQKLDIMVESFRDKVVPGTPESITIKVTMNKQPTEAAMMLLMQSQALLDIKNQPFDLNRPGYYVPTASLRSSRRYVSGYISGEVTRYTYPTFSMPGLNLYGMSFANSSNTRSLYIRGSRIRKAAMATANGVVEETVDEEPVLYATAADYSANMKMSGARVSVAESAEAEEVADEADAGGETTGEGTQAKEEFSYRPSEIPLAFFAPMLTTDADGSLSYTYTVPDANTTWQLRALAYTPELLTASLSRAVFSSRPVMVESNPTRFLRYGDSTEMQTTVMNATDSVQVVTVEQSVLCADDMSTISTDTKTATLPAGEGVTLGIPVEAPHGGQALLYRVKAVAGNYSDGEQTIIPLLPASQPVTKSSTFFIAPDSTHFSMQLPHIPGNNTTTLYMYDNPLWEVVTALPSLSDGDTKTSIAATNSLYMASVARSIMKKNPGMRKALGEWLNSDRSDSTLTSMLQRNDNLKQITLNATPWVQEAMSDKARIDRLALILDDRYLNATIERSIKKLGQLACNDGGIAWCDGYMHSSSWATHRFLTIVANIQMLGCMPQSKQLDTIVNKAIGYIDNEMERTMKLDKGQGDYTAYSYMRSLLRGNKPSVTAQKAISLTVKRILSNWKTHSTVAKGVDAVILYYNNYPTMAREIVKSINAHSMSSPERGQWWDNLGVNVAADLLHTIEIVTPGDKKSIEAVAQWLILNKTNQSWGNGVNTSSAIGAVLSAIDVDKATHGECSVTIEGRQVTDDSPQMPGMTVADISASVSGDTHPVLTVNKSTGLQAMGSLITRYVQAMDSIEPSGHPSVTIEKRTTLVKGTGVTAATGLKVGDRVRTQLVIKVHDDLDYVTVVDRRAACLEPVDQLSGYTSQDRLWYYREVTDSETRLYIYNLPRGTYVIDTDMDIVARGRFTSGVATLQSQINPGVTANSGACPMQVAP
ncbi:MAG: hypothetical protein NC082_02675 [Clostridiales bacterium]|nr:hypothetical protein [Clostridiales bacterium]